MGTTGSACTAGDGQPQCASCTDQGSAYYLSAGAACEPIKSCDADSEYQTATPTPTADRQCAIKVCTCGTGRYGATGSACDMHGTVQCVSCSNLGTEYYLSGGSCFNIRGCTDSEYETAEPTGTSDRECATKACTCNEASPRGTPATGTACPTHGALKCVACSDADGFYLNVDGDNMTTFTSYAVPTSASMSSYYVGTDDV